MEGRLGSWRRVFLRGSGCLQWRCVRPVAVLGSEPSLCSAEFLKDQFEWFLSSEGTAKGWGAESVGTRA